MNDRPILTDDMLRRALQQRMAHAASPLLLERIVAGAGATSQDRTPGAWLRGRGAGRPWIGMPALAGVVAALVVAVAVVLTFRPAVTGPGGTPSPLPSPTPLATVLPAPTPEAIPLGAADALRLPLGSDVAPIDVAIAFGSVWTANIHANDVRRFDLVTMEERARIPVPGGPAWFTVADGALWVTSQNGDGINRIDPATDTVVATIGDAPPCAAPAVVDDGSIWQAACDGNVFLHIDPATNALTEAVPADGRLFLVAARGLLVTVGPAGLDRLDPATGTFTSIPGTTDVLTPEALASDGENVYVTLFGRLLRIDPETGERLELYAGSDGQSVSFVDGRAWLATSLNGVIELDLATGQEIRTVPITGNPAVPREDAGVLWVTDFDNSFLWRIEP
jgi:DNA-binding beta-propeller fold protein YncE